VTGISGDDLTTTGIPIGFTFSFCGVNYTTVSACSNGWLSFANTTATTYINTLANVGGLAPCVMPLWDDLHGTPGAASYQTTGTAPNRVFTFEWKDWRYYPLGAGTPEFSMQVKLFETSNVIHFIYSQLPVGLSVTPSSTICIAKNGTDYLSLASATATPIASSTTFTETINTFPPTGQIYIWTPPAPCFGTPNAGNAVFNPGCPGNVILTNYSIATQLTFQWESKTNCLGATWQAIPGANNYYYNLPAVTIPTEFRAIVTCTNGGLSSTSTPVTVNFVAPCYCPSVAGSTSYDDILNVSVGNWSNQSTCGSVAPGPGSIQNRYSNYTTLPPVRLLKGTSYPVSVVTGNCGSSALSYGIAIFVDVNRNGTYDLPTELLYSSAMSTSPLSVSGTIAIPTTALSGVTGMRVVQGYNVNGASIDPCLSYTYGETEDYLVDIQYAPAVTGGGTYCSGETVTLTATATGVTNPQYLWVKPGNVYDTNSTIVLSPAQVNQSGNYVIYLLTASCNGNIPDTIGGRVVNVTINQTPPAPSVASLIVYCQNEPFDSIVVYGQNLKWYTVPTGGTATTAKPFINTAQLGTITYYVSQTNMGCEGPRAPVTINVVPKPAPPQVVTPVRYCQGDTPAPLQAWGQNIRWYSVPSGGVGTSIIPTPTTNAQGTFTWYVTQTVAGCESKRTPVVVSVSYIPNALITASRPYLCQFDTLTLTYFGNATTTADYIWTLPNGASIVSGSGQGPLVIRFDSSGNQTVKLTVDNGGCVGPQAKVDIFVKASPRFALDIQPDACKGDLVNVAVSYSTAGIDSYDWTDFAGGEVVYGALTKGPYGIRWNTPGEKIFTVIATDDICKSLPVEDMITIHDLPDATISVNTNNICSGDSILFSAPYDATNTYQWLPHQFFDQTNSSQKWGTVDFTRYVTLKVTSDYNCKSSDSVLITAKPCCQIYFPNAFSPNGDGKNDLFRPLTDGHHEVTSLRVQNRWGQTVFETADEKVGWDGTLNGVPQDIGTYFYYIKYKCSDNKFYEDKGELMLVR
jgi:gliding motility-associated-like protein